MGAPEESPNTVVLRIVGRIDPAVVTRLCGHVRMMLEPGDTDLVLCDVSGLVAPDAVVIDTLARMQLTARRLGCSIRLQRAGPDLVDLLTLAGLADVVRGEPVLGVEVSGQPEPREQPLRIEEEVQPDDRSV